MESWGNDWYRSEFGVADLGAGWVGTPVELGVDLQALAVLVAPIKLTTTSWLVKGRPRQFMEMWLNRRCSIFICTGRRESLAGQGF